MIMSEKSVAEQVQDQLNRWNPPPTDNSLERVVGVTPPEGDTRATSHVPMSELNKGFTDSGVDAQRQYADDGDDDDGLPEVPLDEDGDPDYDSMKNDDLKAHLAARNLPVSGKHADLVERLEEDDAAEDDDEE